MKKLGTILFLNLFVVFANAQQIGAFSYIFYKPMLVNPAFTGSTGYYNAMIVSRSQWTGFKGSPQLNMLLMDGNLKNKNVGLGLILLSDRRGISNRVGGNVSYSYRLKLNKDAYALFGVSVGVINQSFDFSKVIVETNTDPTLFTNPQHKITYDANAGFAIIWKTLEFGASVPQIAGNKVSFKADSISGNYTQERHYIGYLKYKISLEKEKGIAIVPQAIVRVVPNAPLQYDGIINFDYNDKFWIGATYKSNYAIAANAGIRIKQHFYVGYSYDFIIGSIGKYSGMSHEIMLNFKFGKGDEKEPASVVEKEEPVEVVTKETPAKPENKVVETDSAATPKLGDLTTLLLLNLIKEIETILDNPNATPIQILDLKNRISAFSNSDFADATMKSKVEQYTAKLKLPSEKSPDIVVKGKIILEESKEPINYSSVTITVIVKATEETVGTYSCNSKTGTYLLILRPDEKYQIIIENDDYQIYMEDLFYPSNTDKKEIIQEIRLKK